MQLTKVFVEGASSKSKILCEVETKVERTFDASNFDEEDRDLAIALYSESPVPTREFQRIEANKKLLPSIEIEKEHLSSSLSVAEVANEKIARVLQAFEKIQGIEKRRNEEEAAKEKILYLERKKEIIQLEIDCLKLRFPQDDKFKHAIQGHLGPFFEVNFRPIQYCPNEKLEVFEEYFASLKQQCTTELQKKDAILQRIFNLQVCYSTPTLNCHSLIIYFGG